MRPATTKAQMRLSSNSAPALIFHFIDPKTENNLSTDLEQVTTVPGPTVQAASIDQYSIEMTSLRRLDGFTLRYMMRLLVIVSVYQSL